VSFLSWYSPAARPTWLLCWLIPKQNTHTQQIPAADDNYTLSLSLSHHITSQATEKRRSVLFYYLRAAAAPLCHSLLFFILRAACCSLVRCEMSKWAVAAAAILLAACEISDDYTALCVRLIGRPPDCFVKKWCCGNTEIETHRHQPAFFRQRDLQLFLQTVKTPCINFL
jgi:hypothetical protein